MAITWPIRWGCGVGVLHKLCVGKGCSSIIMGTIDTLPLDSTKDCRSVPSRVGATSI